MSHDPRLTGELRALLQRCRVAALGTLGADGAPFVSMVPYALEPADRLVVLHVSGLAAHTRNLQQSPAVSLLVMQPEVAGEPVHALPRVTLEGKVLFPERGSPVWNACRAAYLARFPEAEPMTQLGDFMFAAVECTGARQVAGFGAARSVDATDLRHALGPPA